MVFTQFGVAALAVGVVHLLEAAAKHPPMTKVAAALFFAIAGKCVLLNAHDRLVSRPKRACFLSGAAN